MDIFETRRLNLINFIGDITAHGRVAAFAREHDEDPTYLRQLISKNRRIGEKAARRLEGSIKMKPGQLDIPVSDINEPESLSKEALEFARQFDRIPDHLKPAALKWLKSLQDSES